MLTWTARLDRYQRNARAHTSLGRLLPAILVAMCLAGAAIAVAALATKAIANAAMVSFQAHDMGRY